MSGQVLVMPLQGRASGGSGRVRGMEHAAGKWNRVNDSNMPALMLPPIVRDPRLPWHRRTTVWLTA